MPCYHPITAWKPKDLDAYDVKTGKAKLVFNRDRGLNSTKTELACGQCIGCRLDRARSWAARILHESKLHPVNCFVTLTYGDKYVPEDGSLNKRDIQLFLKRLRKANPQTTIRFFQCGEYGAKNSRPHHHLILFNYDFPDKKLYKTLKGNKHYISESLFNLWPYGYHTISDVTFDSAMYTARYVLKKVTGKSAEDHYQGKLPEYTTMSRKPGIGYEWFKRFQSDVYSYDRLVIHHNFIMRPPAYYDRLYDLECPSDFAALKKQRREKAKSNADNTPERLAVREAHRALTILQTSQRLYENE